MADLLMLALAMLVAGAIAGVLAGLFGIGGGVIIVPVMEFALSFFGVDITIRMHIAVATSLAIIIPTSIASSRAHHSRGAVDIDLVKRWALFVLVGALLGAYLAAGFHGRVLSGIFAVFALLVAAKLIFHVSDRAIAEEVPRGMAVTLIPTGIGTLSSMLGIGGGTISVMILTLFGQPIHRAVGTASLFGLVISLPGALGFVWLGWDDPRLPPFMLGYVSLVGFALVAPMTVLAAPIGVKIAHGLSRRTLSLAFGIFLLIASGRMFYQTLTG